MTKKLSPKLAQKAKRNDTILLLFKKGKSEDGMTMGIVDDIQSHFQSNGEKISVSTILRIIRNSKL